jgi:hypothetical protein
LFFHFVKSQKIAPKLSGLLKNYFAPQADDFAPHADDLAPQAEDFAPQADDFAPQADDFAPHADDFAPQAAETLFKEQPFHSAKFFKDIIALL